MCLQNYIFILNLTEVTWILLQKMQFFMKLRNSALKFIHSSDGAINK